MTRRRPNNEDNALWRHATRNVAPLDPVLRGDPPAAPRPSRRRSASSPPPSTPPSPPVLGSVPAKPVILPAAQPFNAAHGRRLKRGGITVDAVLDLHGLTEEAAHAQFGVFLRRAQALGNRTLLVITGKGRSGQGVLKRSLSQWVAGDFAHAVAGLFPAHPRHGGGGAFYVVLRRGPGEAP